MMSRTEAAMRSNKVVECIDKGKPCAEPSKRFCKAKRLSTEMCVHHSQREIQSFHKGCVDCITIGVLQPRFDSILVPQDKSPLNFHHASFGASFMDRGVIEVVSMMRRGPWGLPLLPVRGGTTTVEYVLTNACS